MMKNVCYVEDITEYEMLFFCNLYTDVSYIPDCCLSLTEKCQCNVVYRKEDDTHV